MRSIPSGSFERLSSPLALWRAYVRYRRGKRRTRAVACFDLDADLHLLELAERLRDARYVPRPYRLHVVRDPKLRLIAAAPVIDRVVHQALVTELAPHYDRGFLFDNYASRLGRGPHRAVLRYLGWTRRYRFRLSLDIHRYFPSIHQETLCAILFCRLRDERTRALVRSLLEVGGKVYQSELAREAMQLDREPVAPGSGVPIGSYFSQWSGALYLDGLDHYVARVLKIPGYLRYMDDCALFSDDRQALESARAAIAGWLLAERRLTLNPKRGHIHPTTAPSTFLGYRVSRAGVLPGPKLKRRLATRLRAAAARGPAALARTIRAYAGLLTF